VDEPGHAAFDLCRPISEFGATNEGRWGRDSATMSTPQRIEHLITAGRLTVIRRRWELAVFLFEITGRKLTTHVHSGHLGSRWPAMGVSLSTLEKGSGSEQRTLTGLLRA